MICDSTQIRVRYSETDQMGVVYHSNYYSWFDIGRTDWMREAGMSYRDMERRGILLPLLESHCVYLHSAKYDDQLTVHTRITKLRGIRFTVEYEVIRDADGLLLARGSTVHVFTDADLKPVNVKKKHPEIYEIFQKNVE